MAAEHILRIPRNDSEGNNVLVNVISNGTSMLDLKLLATEGESPYIAQSRLSTCKMTGSKWLLITQVK